MQARSAVAGGLLILAIAATGCTPGRPAGALRRLPVVATFYPLAEFALRVGGDRVTVRTLVPPGVESHDFEPTPRDLTAVAQAQVFIYNGAGFEPWVDRLLPELPARVARVNATEGLSLLRPPWPSAGADPHVWLDPVLAGLQVERIRAALVRVDPAGTEAYEAGARALRAELDALHRRFARVLGDCRRREFVTTHAAFGYLAARYGLRQVSIAGMTPEAEPSPARLREIVAYVRRSGATVVYAETLANPGVAEAVARETGATVRVLNPLEGLTREERSRGLTYTVVMDENLRNLAEGLGCVQ